MFQRATPFNEDIESWNTFSETDISISSSVSLIFIIKFEGFKMDTYCI